MRSIMEMAKELVEYHCKIDSVASAWLGDSTTQIQLIEVCDYETPSDVFLPWRYPASEGFDVETLFLAVSPEEWKQIQSGERTLPTPFNKDTLQCIYERKITADEARIAVLEEELAELKAKVAKEKVI